jgi:Xaa-Pro aminopeptidase
LFETGEDGGREPAAEPVGRAAAEDDLRLVLDVRGDRMRKIGRDEQAIWIFSWSGPATRKKCEFDYGRENMMLKRINARAWETPLYADFARVEFDDRVKRMQELLATNGIDILVVWDEKNIRYFTGFHNNLFPNISLQPAAVLIPSDSDLVIIVPDFLCGVAEGYTYIDDIRLLVDPHVTANIRNVPVMVADVVKEFGFGSGTIGMETGSLGGMTIPRPLNDIDRFRGELGSARFVGAGDLIWKLRSIKSSAEVEALKQATRAAIDTYIELVGAFRPGMTERDVGLLIRKGLIDKVHDCDPPLVTASSRRIPMYDVPPWDDGIPLNPGDRLILEPVPAHKGYYGSCCRIFNIGPLSDEVQQRAELIDRVQERAIAQVKPGVTTGRLWDVMNEGFQEYAGEEYVFDQGGHGVGLRAHEPPMIAKGEDLLVEEGMVLAVETWTIGKGGGREMGPVYGVEDYVVVTGNGADVFPGYPKEQRVLGA